VYAYNQGWLFGGPYVSGAEAPGYPESGFTNVTLPHTVTPLSWGDWDPSAWEQIWVYRKHVNQSGVAADRVFIDFQGVMTSATVFLGGVQIAQHQGGYLPWSVELTRHLVAGDNLLAVVVDSRWLDVPPDGASAGAKAVDYLEPGGIYRDVALRIVPELFLSDVFARPANVLAAGPSVDVQFTIDAASLPSDPVTITADLLDGASQMGSATGTVSVTATGTTVATLSITGFGGVTLWSPDTPKLYQISATLTADGASHTVQVNTGFRQATFEAGGFYLNGERLKIFGLNRHQLFPFTGMAAPERLQRRDAELLKNELNCNMVRCSHYPQSPYFLDACDELGLMVWEEPPGWQYLGDAAFEQIVLQNVHDMVVRDRNRPSVIVWATRLNETAGNQALYQQTRQLAYTLDGSRQTSGAMDTQSTSGWAEDVFAYDDYHASNGNATLEPPVSGVPYMVSEAVGALDGAPLYRWVDTTATLATQARMHAQVHDIAQSDPAYAGLLGWAGIDYASLNGGDRTWHNVKWPGVLDTFRVAKPGAAFYRSQIDPALTPIVLPVFFWDFGPNSPASGPGPGSMIATNCDRVEVYVASQHLTTGTPDTQDFGSLAYPPVLIDLTVDGTALPDLRVDGYVGSQLVSSLQMSSDPRRDRLVLSVEDSSIQGDGSDTTRFTFRALDAYGNQRPYPSGDVTLALAGPATLIGDNPFAFAAYGGVGGALVRSEPGSSGVVTVTAMHPALGQASGVVTVVAVPVPIGSSGPPASPPPVEVAPPSPTRPAPAGPASIPEGASKSSVRSALAAVLSPSGVQARIPKLLQHGGYTFKFDAPSAGKLVIDWYYVPKAAHVTKTRRPARVLVASISASMKHAEHRKVKLKLTARGRLLLKHAKHERVTVKASFTPTVQSTTTSSKVITLRR
jgi:beta-galactosidase